MYYFLNSQRKKEIAYFMNATSGNDSNTGRSRGQAWKTIAKLITAMPSLPSNAKVYFERGETFSDARWDFPASTPSGLTFKACGSGAKPIIASALGTRVDVGGSFTFRNLDFRATGAGPTVAVFVSNCLFEDCDGTGNAAQNNGVWVIGGATLSNVTLRRCTGTGSNYYGVHVYDAGANTMTNVIVENGTYYNNGSGTATGFHGIYFSRGAQNCIARFNECYDNSGSGIKSNAEHTDSSQRNYIYGNYCHDNNNYGLYLGGLADYVDAYNNVLYLNDGGTSNGMGIALQVGAVCNIYHNTIVNHANTGIRWINTGLSGNVVKNNIIVQDSAVVGAAKNPMSFATDATWAAQNNTFDNNLYYYGGAAIIKRDGAGTLTLAGWQALTGTPDLNSVSADAVFHTNYTNLHLQTTSPAKNTGATGLGITTDYDGVTRDATPDMGAYEFA